MSQNQRMGWFVKHVANKNIMAGPIHAKHAFLETNKIVGQKAVVPIEIMEKVWEAIHRRITNGEYVVFLDWKILGVISKLQVETLKSDLLRLGYTVNYDISDQPGTVGFRIDWSKVCLGRLSDE